MTRARLVTIRASDVPPPTDLSQVIFSDRSHIVLNVLYPYCIPRDRCKTQADILAWTRQLSDKTWMTSELLRRFIDVALKANGLARQPV